MDGTVINIPAVIIRVAIEGVVTNQLAATRTIIATVPRHYTAVNTVSVPNRVDHHDQIAVVRG